MDQVLEILKSLGINSTVFYQFGIFFVAYLSLSFIVFKPYLNAYKERQSRTVGGQKEAENLLSEVELQEETFKEKAKKLNSEIKAIFNAQNEKAKKEVDEILMEAKNEAETETESARQELQNSILQVRKDMESHIPEISQNIEKKFLRQ